jgi:hypothetical protein
MKKAILAAAIACTLGLTGAATAGMQGQGAKPDAKGPEWKEPNPGPYRERFMEMDTDKDGFLSRNDIVGPQAEEVSKQWEKLDKNKDDKLNATEFGGFEHESQSGTGAAASDRSPEAPSGASEGESAQQKQ